MVFGKAITFDEENLTDAASTAGPTAFCSIEQPFLDRLRAGDADAFDNLVLRYSSDVYGLLCRLAGDREEAAELTQETFLSALKGIGKFRGDSELKTWLFRIAVNHSRNRFRWWKRRRRDATISLDAETGDFSRTVSETIADRSASPEDNAMLAERSRRLKAALATLPDVYREAVVLCDVHGMTYEQIAVTLDVQMGTVKSRIARGREELRRKLTDF
ncbi:MAG: sigma-70 family RNA polymerase sigma factor [Acidobacteria bacterium]|nr:sigma-70 family RNA polymerase sigma factor [Acidobacteriota bacterium]